MTRRLVRSLRRYLEDTAGAAAVEVAMWLVILAAPIFGVVDLGFYVFQKMQVQNAAQAAAQTAWTTCNSSSKWRAANANCGASGANLNSAIANGAHSTSLGALVTVLSGSDGYYCTDASGALVSVGTVGVVAAGANVAPTKPNPFTCASVVAGSTTAPAEYVLVNVSFSYHAIFKGASPSSLLPATVTQSAWARMN